MTCKEEGKLGACLNLSDKNNYEGKFNTLRIISLKAISEFETLQKKCEENYVKYLEERKNYMRTKKELDVLKEASGDALGEYENLHRKFEIEQDCRDKAEEFATKAVQENKKLKRQSTFLLNALNTKIVDFDLEELAKAEDDYNSASTTIEDHAFCNEQITELKKQVELLKIKTDEVQKKLTETEDKLKIERQEHKKTKDELENNKANLKQLRRVSQLALDEYSYLKQKYVMEAHHRVEAEKIADEETNTESVFADETMVFRDHEAMVKQNEVVLNDVSQEDRLKKALDEISTLTKKLHDQKTDFDEKVKELEEELSSSNDTQKLKNVEGQVRELAKVLQNYEERLDRAQTRANEAEAKATDLEDQLKKAKESTTTPPPTPPLPPPPPPPPPPLQLMSKFVQIIGGGRKKKQKKGAEKEDPRVTAMSEMMERIKGGNVTLRKISDTTEVKEKGEAIENLKYVLKSLHTKDKSPDSSEGAQKVDFGVKLKPATERNRSSSSVDQLQQVDLRTNLRKPRSRSTGDVLEDDDPNVEIADKQLRDLLNKRKAAADREIDSPVTTEEKKLEKNDKENGEEDRTNAENGDETVHNNNEESVAVQELEK